MHSKSIIDEDTPPHGEIILRKEEESWACLGVAEYLHGTDRVFVVPAISTRGNGQLDRREEWSGAVGTTHEIAGRENTDEWEHVCVMMVAYIVPWHAGGPALNRREKSVERPANLWQRGRPPSQREDNEVFVARADNDCVGTCEGTGQ